MQVSELDCRIRSMTADWQLATYEVLDTAETALITIREKLQVAEDPYLIAELTRLILEQRDRNLNRQLATGGTDV